MRRGSPPTRCRCRPPSTRSRPTRAALDERQRAGGRVRPELDVHERSLGRQDRAPRAAAVRDRRSAGAAALRPDERDAGVRGRDVAGRRRGRAEREPRRARLRARPDGRRVHAPRPRPRSGGCRSRTARPRPGSCCSARSCSSRGRSASPRCEPTVAVGAAVDGRAGAVGDRDRAAGLDPARCRRSQGQVKVGDPVTITLPDNQTTPGRITLRELGRDTAARTGVRRRSRSTRSRPTRPRPAISTRRRSTSRSRPAA